MNTVYRTQPDFYQVKGVLRVEQSETRGIERDIWGVVERRLLPENASELFCLGVTGSPFRTLAAPLLYSDFAAFLLPGLRALGIEAALQPLPDDPQQIVPFLRDLNRGAACTVYRFGGEPILEKEAWESDDETDIPPTQQDRKRIVLRRGVVSAFDAEGVRWEDTSKQASATAPEQFLSLFSYGIRLRPGRGKETRRICLLGAIRRAVVYRLAFPDLALSDADADRQQQTAAAQFLLEAAGRQRDPVSLRWKQAAEYLEQGDSAAAWERLYGACLRGLDLPSPVLDALASGEDARLTDLEIRELIYLARAGNRDLKVFAIRRLARERSNRTIRQTLDSFAFYPDPLIRGAASVKA